MSLWNRFKNFLTGGNTKREEISFDNPSLINYLVGNEEITEAVFSVVSKQANIFASLPLKMIDKDYKQPTDCAAFNLMREGPGYLTRFDFFRDIETIKNLTGNAYVQLFKDINGKVIDMKIISNGSCRPVIDYDSGELYYHVQSRKGSSMYVHYMEILHFKHIRIGNSIEGSNPLDILNNSLTFDSEVRKISLKQLNGTNEGIKVKLGTNMEDEDKKATIQMIAKFYQENGGLIVEENGVEIERIKRELIDTKLLDIDKITKSKIAMVYNVPEHFVNGNDSSKRTQEQLNMEYLTYNLLPNIVQYEEELQKKTVTQKQKLKDYRYKFNVGGLLRADTQTRGAFYQIMRRGGGFSANEVRILEDHEPSDKPGMDDYHISGDLYPIDMDPKQRKTTKVNE